MDYRKLNEKTIKNAYPLLHAQDLIDQLKNATLFSKMDIQWGYNNIRMRRDMLFNHVINCSESFRPCPTLDKWCIQANHRSFILYSIRHVEKHSFSHWPDITLPWESAQHPNSNPV